VQIQRGGGHESGRNRSQRGAREETYSEVDALSVITIFCGRFERCCSNNKTRPYHSNLSFVALRNRRPKLLRAPAYRTPSEASPRRRCGHASRFLWVMWQEGTTTRGGGGGDGKVTRDTEGDTRWARSVGVGVHIQINNSTSRSLTASTISASTVSSATPCLRLVIP